MDDYESPQVRRLRRRTLAKVAPTLRYADLVGEEFGIAWAADLVYGRKGMAKARSLQQMEGDIASLANADSPAGALLSNAITAITAFAVQGDVQRLELIYELSGGVIEEAARKGKPSA